MNEILAKFRLFSHVHKGLTTSTTAGNSGDISVKLSVKREAKQDSDTKIGTVNKSLKMFGPGDIIGIDQRIIIRTSPKKHINNFESTSLVAIEFSRPDFPWMFTPQPPKNGKAKPWLVLIVVKSEGATIKNNTRLPLPMLTINNVSSHNLPNLRDAWAWAHVQGDEDVNEDKIKRNLEEILDKTPEKLISRIICTQTLEANTRYFACLVPAYKAGVLAGLGEDVTELSNDLAWNENDSLLRLPLYYHWEFSTGEAGDFKTLVRLLEGRKLPEGVGTRQMDIDSPGAGLDFSDSSPINFESALMPPGFKSSANSNEIKVGLKNFLNQPSQGNMERPVLGPPLYGNNQANREKIHENEVSRTWFNKLNLDPRNRATAGLGTKVIQKDQEHLMHSAWEQIGELKSVNEYLRQAQLARSSGAVLHQKHLSNLPITSLLQVTHTVQTRIMDAGGEFTIANTIHSGRIPPALFTGAFGRLTRPGGNFAKRIYGNKGLDGIGELFNDLNNGTIDAEPDLTPPDGMVTPESVDNPIPKKSLPRWLEERLLKIYKILKGIGIGLIVLFFVAVSLKPIIVLIVFALLFIVSMIIKWLRDRINEREQYDFYRPETFTGEAIREVEIADDFTLLQEDEDFTVDIGNGFILSSDNFKNAASAVLDDFYYFPIPETNKAKPKIDFAQKGEQILEALNPEKTIPNRVRSRLDIPDSLINAEDPIEPIKAAPSFPQPMYTALRDLSNNFILSGLDKIPPNTITIAQTNRKFIEAYMTGINHEMGRELLWRGFPTELRATYFRQFWDAGNRPYEKDMTLEENEELARDIDQMHRWRKDLGKNPAILQIGGDSDVAEPLVLLIRGDLLRRFPNTILYAIKAKKNVSDNGGNENYRIPDTSQEKNIKFPLFKGSMEPDVTFFGFDLTQEEVVSSANPGDNENHGWFFVLQEPVSDLSFKLQKSDTFSTLINNNIDNNNAAKVASAIYNSPTLFAIHAGDLISKTNNV